MSDLTENPMLKIISHPISRMTPEDRALLEEDQLLYGTCFWCEPADGSRPYRIDPKDVHKKP